jgi:hypothetical protein
MPNKAQTFDSTGPDIRVRGNAYQVLEKYLQLARDAGTAGDRVAAENFLQHADHYYRVVASLNEGQRPRIGGREVSVADMNVANVSQGLSAAMSGHGHSSGGEDHQNDSQQGGGNGQNRPAQGQSQGHPQSQSQGHGQGHNQGRSQGRSQGHHQGHPQGGNSDQHNSGDDGSDVHQPGDVSGNVSVGNSGDAQNFGPPEEQPDYPEELLPADGRAAATQDSQGDGNRPGDHLQGDNRQGDNQQGGENRPQGRLGRGRRRGPGRRVRNDGEETAVAATPPVPNPDNAQ